MVPAKTLQGLATAMHPIDAGSSLAFQLRKQLMLELWFQWIVCRQTAPYSPELALAGGITLHLVAELIVIRSES
jgi:hypothetical protein